MQWPSWARLWREKPGDDNEGDANSGINSKRPASSPPPPSPNTILPQHTKPYSWESNLNTTDWTHYTTPQTLAFGIATAAATLGLVSLWKTYLRRIPTVSYLKPGFFHRRSVFGYVTRVGDGDNFHLFHTPGGRMLGWGWAPGRRVGTWKGKELKGKTMHVRLAGVDAPEAAHFGRPAQPYSQEAIDWLKAAVLGRWVRVWPYREDQYKRVVSSVQRRRFLFLKRDVGLDMLKAGLATVYEAKYGSEFGDREEEYRAAEDAAKKRKVGMWSEPGLVARMLGKKKEVLETPREYKTRMTGQEKGSDMAK